MRFAAPLCALLSALSLPVAASAALGLEAASSERPAVEVSSFKEDGSQHYEKARNFRLQEQKRALVTSQARGIALTIAPVVLIILATFLYVRARKGGKRRSRHRKMMQAEVRRRAGGPEQMVDPRQW